VACRIQALTSARAAPSRTSIASARFAQGELQGVDQDRLAGTGLAGEHGEAGVELDFEVGDDDDVEQRQPAQHG